MNKQIKKVAQTVGAASATGSEYLYSNRYRAHSSRDGRIFQDRSQGFQDFVVFFHFSISSLRTGFPSKFSKCL